MREIKFRAWDGKEMILPEKGYKGAGSGVFVLLMDLQGKTSWNNPYGFSPEEPTGELTLMQFTGLKDKHGNPIYEGDIVKHRNGIKQDVYDDSSASFQMGLSNHVLDQELVPYDGIEVIGNIYQNSELIKQAAT